MKHFTRGFAALLIAALALGGCSRHSAPAAQKSLRRPNDSAVVALKPEAAPAASGERATAITEESEVASADIPAGLSPIAAAVAANTPSPATPIPAKWVEGQQYNALMPAQPTLVAPDKVEVVEVFWYGCGHCFHLDPTLEAWRTKSRAPYVEFRRIPVMWNEMTRAHARLFYTIEALGKLEQLHALVFREIHLNGNVLADADPAKTEQLQRAFLLANGVSAAEFDNAYRSFDVDSKLRLAEDLTRRYRATGVPLLVVNGKYTADVGTAGGEPELTQLVSDLAASEHRR
jgi:thiol:disulfide interchange protein DsbA